MNRKLVASVAALVMSACGGNPEQGQTATNSAALSSLGAYIGVQYSGAGTGRVNGTYRQSDGTEGTLLWVPTPDLRGTYLPPGTTVTLTAVEDPGSGFTGFRRPYCDVNPCDWDDPEFMPPSQYAWSPAAYTFVLNDDTTVSVRFVPVPTATLTVYLNGTGEAKPVGLMGGTALNFTCIPRTGGQTCTAPATLGADVQLAYTRPDGSSSALTFQRFYCEVYPNVCGAGMAQDPEWMPPSMYAWSTEPYTVSMQTAKAVNAMFTTVAPPPRVACTPNRSASPRYVDNGDLTVTDYWTCLMWEKKTGTRGGPADYTDPHNINNTYTFETAGTTAHDGTIFTDFLAKLNGGGGFAGYHDWRLPNNPGSTTAYSTYVTPTPGDTVNEMEGVASQLVGLGIYANDGAYWTGTAWTGQPPGDELYFIWGAPVNGGASYAALGAAWGSDRNYARAVRNVGAPIACTTPPRFDSLTITVLSTTVRCSDGMIDSQIRETLRWSDPCQLMSPDYRMYNIWNDWPSGAWEGPMFGSNGITEWTTQDPGGQPVHQSFLYSNPMHDVVSLISPSGETLSTVDATMPAASPPAECNCNECGQCVDAPGVPAPCPPPSGLAAPVAAPRAAQITSEGVQIADSATFTDANSTETHTATIDWGDGQISSGVVGEPYTGPGTGIASGTHVYADNGVYAETICVTDSSGLTGCSTRDLTVFNQAPSMSTMSALVGTVGVPISLDVPFTDPGTADTHMATVSWGDGSPTEAAHVSEPTGSGAGTIHAAHAYAARGPYYYTVCVTDDDGAQQCASSSIYAGPP